MITVALAGDYYTPHLVLRIGNTQVRLHSENYSNRSNAKRAQKTLVKNLKTAEYPIVMVDETKPIR